MTASAFALRPSSGAATPVRRPRGWLLGGSAALAVTAVAGVVALLLAAALAVAAVLALAVLLLGLAAARARGGRAAGRAVITARWTGCGWDAQP